MKRKILVCKKNYHPLALALCTLLLFTLLFSCTKKTEKQETAPKIYTSLFAFEHFAEQILPNAEVESIIPAGIDPHEFEPSLKDIQKLHNATMVIYLGNTDVDRWIDKIRQDLIQKGVKVVRIQDSLQLKKYSASDEIDPHIWLDPIFAKEILKIIKEKAIEISPQNKYIIEKNFLSYEQKLKELEQAYNETLSDCKLKDVVSTHEFLNYLSARYRFNSHFIVHEPEQEPSPKHIKRLKELMKTKSIEYIISEPEGEKLARALSEETKAKILNFNTYHTKSNSDYIEVMKSNLNLLSIALQCKKSTEH